MKDYIVEYHFQGVFEAEPSYDVIILQAENEEEARRKVEWEHWLIHAAVDDIVPCKEIDYVVDLCIGIKTESQFVVKGLFPEDPTKAQGSIFLAALGTAETEAYETIHKDYPAFSKRLNAVLRHSSPYHIQHPADSMVIVRPAHWIENGKKGYLVTVFYHPYNEDLSIRKDLSRFSVEVLARDSKEARIIGIKKATPFVCGKIQSDFVMRTAEKPNNRAG